MGARRAADPNAPGKNDCQLRRPSVALRLLFRSGGSFGWCRVSGASPPPSGPELIAESGRYFDGGALSQVMMSGDYELSCESAGRVAVYSPSAPRRRWPAELKAQIVAESYATSVSEVAAPRANMIGG